MFYYIQNFTSKLIPNSCSSSRMPLRSFPPNMIRLAPSCVSMPSTSSSQPSGRASLISVCARSATFNVSRDTIVALHRTSTRGPVTRSATETLPAASSSERPRKRIAVASGSTFESSAVKQVRTERLVTTESPSMTPTAAAAASLNWVSSSKV